MHYIDGMSGIFLKKLFLVPLFLVCMVIAALSTPSYAQSGITIVRDTEIENILRSWSEPVIKAADLDPAAVNFILVQSNDINAFVAGGPNIFIFTGLLLKSENPGEIVGVIAHELGHIRGGHLVRTRGALENASYENVLGTILGIGAAVLTGNGGAGLAIASGASSVAQNKFLAFSRVQESSADQAALDYMERAALNPEGLVTFMQKLGAQELLPASQQTEYVRTHPLTSNRVNALKGGLERSQYSDKKYPAEWNEQHKRINAKLLAFISPQNVEWEYDARDNSIPALYAKSIAAYRQNNIEKALTIIDRLIAMEPENPYFLELKGQMLVEFGQVPQSISYYKKSVESAPNGSLIRIAYAHALIETASQSKAQNQNAQFNEAIKQLERAMTDEPRSTRVHRLLASAYGRLGNDAIAKLHLAEEALLKRELPYAERQAKIALETLEPGTPQYIRAKDILSFIEQEQKKS
jgi:predicted Zn-dependent protease